MFFHVEILFTSLILNSGEQERTTKTEGAAPDAGLMIPPSTTEALESVKAAPVAMEAAAEAALTAPVASLAPDHSPIPRSSTEALESVKAASAAVEATITSSVTSAATAVSPMAAVSSLSEKRGGFFGFGRSSGRKTADVAPVASPPVPEADLPAVPEVQAMKEDVVNNAPSLLTSAADIKDAVLGAKDGELSITPRPTLIVTLPLFFHI